MFLCLALLLILCIGLYCAPLLRPRRPVLPVLLIGKIGKPLQGSKNKKYWLCEKKLEKLLAAITTNGFTPVLPQDILSGPLPPHPVCLVFTGGYQNLHHLLLPLLEKYDCRACIALPAGLIGQYDAWQKAEEGPWQNLLTAQEIKQMKESGRVEFISATVDGRPVDPEDDGRALWQLRENKTRLHNIYKLPTNAVYFPLKNPHRPVVLQQSKQCFAMLIGNKTGNNPLPLDASLPLRVFPVSGTVSLIRLLWKMPRK